jgi:hypothetical protein
MRTRQRGRQSLEFDGNGDVVDHVTAHSWVMGHRRAFGFFHVNFFKINK